MNSKPKLLTYGITWREQRNLIFLHYLSHYFEILVITSNVVDENILNYSNPAIIKPVKFFFSRKIGFAFTQNIRKLVTDFNPDFILTLETHSISAMQCVKTAKQIGAQSVIFTWQNLLTIPKLKFQKIIQKKVISDCDILIGGSIDSKEYLIKKGANPNKIFIIPETGYDIRIFSKEGSNLRKFWHFDDDDFVVLYAGRLAKEKGINIILDIASKIQRKNDSIKFVFVGRGPLLNLIKNSSSNNIFYKGAVPYYDMGNVMRSCDLFLYPSLSTKYWVEQFGYSVVEALVCNKPAIVSNSGSLRFFIKNNQNGSIIPEGSAEALESAIFRWFNIKNKKSIFSNSIKENLSGPNIAKAYAEVLIGSAQVKYKQQWY